MSSDDKIRILALHGAGMNNLVFEAITASLRNELGDSYEWHFVEGTIAAKMDSDLEGFFPEDDQYFTYADFDDQKSIARACDDISTYVDLHGPFDIVGCSCVSTAIAATMLLEQPKKRAPFKGAIFFNGLFPSLTPGSENSREILISVPTVNIWGSNDSKHAATARALSKLCTPSINENFIHGNGSTIPGAASEDDLIRAAQVIKKTVYRAVLAH